MGPDSFLQMLAEHRKTWMKCSTFRGFLEFFRGVLVFQNFLKFQEGWATHKNTHYNFYSIFDSVFNIVQDRSFGGSWRVAQGSN